MKGNRWTVLLWNRTWKYVCNGVCNQEIMENKVLSIFLLLVDTKSAVDLPQPNLWLVHTFKLCTWAYDLPLFKLKCLRRMQEFLASTKQIRPSQVHSIWLNYGMSHSHKFTVSESNEVHETNINSQYLDPPSHHTTTNSLTSEFIHVHRHSTKQEYFITLHMTKNF
jgi:hypothetical protein